MANPIVKLMGGPVLAAMLVGGCTEGKSTSFNACHQEWVGYFLESPRPHGSPPDEHILNGMILCMYRNGYLRASNPASVCASPRTVTADCFEPSPRLLIDWLRSFF
jgi:hypothetical protein